MVFLINGSKDEFENREEYLKELQQLIEDGLYEIKSDKIAEEFLKDLNIEVKQ